MVVYDLNGKISTSASGAAGGEHYYACGCVGPQRGEPRCPCQMRGVIERDGRWIVPEQDLGPVRRYEGMPNSIGFSPPPTPKEPA